MVQCIMPQITRNISITGMNHVNNIPTQVYLTDGVVSHKFSYCDMFLCDAIIKQLIKTLNTVCENTEVIIHDMFTFLVISKQVCPISNTTINLLRKLSKLVFQKRSLGFYIQFKVGIDSTKLDFYHKCQEVISNSKYISTFEDNTFEEFFNLRKEWSLIWTIIE